MTELRVSHLIDAIDEMLENKLRIGSHCFWMNVEDLQDILSKIRAVLPEEIKTAEMILKRRDEIFMDAQSRADRIINEAQNTAANILSESELIRAVREKASKIQEQLKESCDEMKLKATEEADNIRKAAQKEAVATREGAQMYAEKVLTDLARDIDLVHENFEQIRKTIKNGQELISQRKSPVQQKQQKQPSDKERVAVENAAKQ